MFKVEYIASVWMKSMGYRTDKNKSKLMKRASKCLPAQKMATAIAFYENFGHNLVSDSERWKLVEQTCKTGWEYFFNMMISLIMQDN